MEKISESYTQIAAQKVYSSKVAFVFGSAFMLLAVGGGAPGLFSLELSLMAGGISVPFIALALVQCKKHRCTYEEFRAVFTGKPYTLSLGIGFGEGISLDPENLGQATSFEEYRKLLAFTIKAKLSVVTVAEQLVDPQYRIGASQVSPQVVHRTDKIDMQTQLILPSLDMLQELFEKALQDQPPPSKELPSKEEAFGVVKANYRDVGLFGMHALRSRWVMPNEVISWESYQAFVERKTKDELSHYFLSKVRGIATANHEWNKICSRNNFRFPGIVFPEPSIFSELGVTFFREWYHLDPQRQEEIINLFARALSKAIVNSMLLAVSDIRYQERLLQKLQNVTIACEFPTLRFDAPLTQNAMQSAQDQTSEWRWGVRVQLERLISQGILLTKKQVFEKLSNCVLTITANGVSTRMPVPPHLPCNPDDRFQDAFLFEWISLLEETILNFNPPTADA